jgi:hypothetical protein
MIDCRDEVDLRCQNGYIGKWHLQGLFIKRGGGGNCASRMADNRADHILYKQRLETSKFSAGLPFISPGI